jgi:hypothetical protein
MGVEEGALEGKQPFKEKTREEAIETFYSDIEAHGGRALAILGSRYGLHGAYGPGEEVVSRLKDLFKDAPNLQIIGTASLPDDFYFETSRIQQGIVRSLVMNQARAWKKDTDTDQTGAGRMIFLHDARFGPIHIEHP